MFRIFQQKLQTLFDKGAQHFEIKLQLENDELQLAIVADCSQCTTDKSMEDLALEELLVSVHGRGSVFHIPDGGNKFTMVIPC